MGERGWGVGRDKQHLAESRESRDENIFFWLWRNRVNGSPEKRGIWITSASCNFHRIPSMDVDCVDLARGKSGLVFPRRTRKLADAGAIESLGAPSLSLSLSLWKSWGSSSLPPFHWNHSLSAHNARLRNEQRNEMACQGMAWQMPLLPLIILDAILSRLNYDHSIIFEN